MHHHGCGSVLYEEQECIALISHVVSCLSSAVIRYCVIVLFVINDELYYSTHSSKNRLNHETNRHDER